jgi:hypothetical protein
MLRALLPLFFALFTFALGEIGGQVAWAQTAPPPDTKAARERHRIQEKEPPPPEGPWGPEEFGLSWNNPVWRGAIVNAGFYGGAGLELNVPRGLAASSDGVNPPIFERLEYHEQSFRAQSIGATADFDMFRLSAMWFDGSFDARATLTYDDEVHPPKSRDLDLHGNAYGFRIGAYWPALRYRDSLMELSVGPIATVGWLHQELSHIPGALLLTRDSLDILTGSFGPKASLRTTCLGNFALEVNAEYSFLTGGARGWTKEFTAGIGFKF